VPDLGRPVELDDVARAERLVAEERAEISERRRPAIGLRLVLPVAGFVAADEAHQDPEAAVRRRRVERDLDRTVLADGLPREALAPPEGRVVDRLELHQRALRHVLCQLVAEWWQRRVVLDAAGQ